MHKHRLYERFGKTPHVWNFQPVLPEAGKERFNKLKKQIANPRKLANTANWTVHTKVN